MRGRISGQGYLTDCYISHSPSAPAPGELVTVTLEVTNHALETAEFYIYFWVEPSWVVMGEETIDAQSTKTFTKTFTMPNDNVMYIARVYYFYNEWVEDSMEYGTIYPGTDTDGEGGEGWWEKYVKWGLIGALGIAALAVILKKVK